jgi:hypothetical protein
MGRSVVRWALVGFVIYLAVTDPVGVAALARHLADGARVVAAGLAKFADGL